GLTVGLTLTLIHMISIPVDNTSVNPARSFGAALFADGDTDALNQLWAFVVFPLIGAVVGVFVWLMLDDTRLEDTLLDNEALREIRDVADQAMDEVVEATTGLPAPDEGPPCTDRAAAVIGPGR
ncbi:MAG TPA: aquaporin, partial [Ilumatobacteraceae bacterium]|nr:aquaporin [Ilumatobacteraceae bacterium]